MTQPVMTLPQITPGIVRPPVNLDQNSVGNDLKSRGDIYDQMMAAQSMYNGQQPQQRGSFLGLLLKVGLVGLGIFVAIKNRSAISEFVSATYSKVRGFKIQITDSDELNRYSEELRTNFQKNSTVGISNVKAVQISLADKADKAKQILKDMLGIAETTKYANFISPNVTIFLKDGSLKHQKAISEAVKNKNMDMLSQEAIDAMDLVRLSYNGKKGTSDIGLTIIENKILENSKFSKSYWQRVKDFFAE